MKLVRTLTRPGGIQFESSVWTVEISSDDLEQSNPGFKSKPIQEQLHIMSLHAEARVLNNHVADGLMGNDELGRRLAPFLDMADFLKQWG